MFKIAFLKLYRLKYCWIDINEILQKIETYSDLEEFLSLFVKFFERLKQNPTLQQDYIVSDEFEEVTNLVNQSELNKQKSISLEENIIKSTTILEEVEKKFTNKDLEKILSDQVDLVWENFVFREENAWVLAKASENNIKEDEEKELEKEDLEELLEQTKQKLFDLDEKKRKLFLEWNYDEIDILNDEIINILKELKKLEKILNIEEEE